MANGPTKLNEGDRYFVDCLRGALGFKPLYDCSKEEPTAVERFYRPVRVPTSPNARGEWRS